MITGIHALIYTKQAEQVREFFKKTLKFPTVDAGHGWLLFALPPAEMGIHPTDKDGSYDLYLMCDNIEKTVMELAKHGARFPRGITTAGWGKVTAIELPGGLEMGLYEARHPTAIGLAAAAKPKVAKKAKKAAKKVAPKKKAKRR
ncbi:MAG: extradiol dioxygenase [Acidobacteriota bacterium]|nr:extradiol dioxygenase [Acidobacteriota bacterium]